MRQPQTKAGKKNFLRKNKNGRWRSVHNGAKGRGAGLAGNGSGFSAKNRFAKAQFRNLKSIKERRKIRYAGQLNRRRRQIAKQAIGVAMGVARNGLAA